MSPSSNPASVPATYIRGGTSKAIFFHEKDIPSPGPSRDKFLLRIMGSPDPTQIDGMGGTLVVTSKVAIIRPSERSDADVDYTFCQVSINAAAVDYDGNCGNISAGVGPFAINERLTEGSKSDEDDNVRIIRIYNTGSKKVIVARVPINPSTGRAMEKGDYAIAGCPGTGAPLFMDYSLVTGASLGRGMLPTNKAVDTVPLNDRCINISICDVANIIVFVDAKDVGVTGHEAPADLTGNKEFIACLKEVRGKAAQLVGMCKDWRKVDEEAGILPMIAVVSQAGQEGDIQSRLFLDNRCHTAMAGTGGVCTTACSRIAGSVVNSLLSKDQLKQNVFKILHPSGILPINVSTEAEYERDGLPTFKQLSFVRTARYLFQGQLMVPEDLPNVFGEDATADSHPETHSMVVGGTSAESHPESDATTTNATSAETNHDVDQTKSTEAVTTQLAKFVAGAAIEDLTPEIVQKLKALLLDWLGVTILGAKVAESSGPLLNAIESLAGGFPPTNTVFGTNKRLPAPYAAMLNASFGHSLDFDDTHAAAMMHPGTTILSTVLAEVENKTDFDFREALLAMAVGYEVSCRIGTAVGDGGYDRGFHTTSAVGIFGAVAALSKLRNFDSKTTENALGLALSFSSGTMQWLENGSWNKRINPGGAAFNAFTVTALAQAGALGAAKAIEGKFGFLAAYSGSPDTKYKVKAITTDLGHTWVFLTTALKPFPACRLTHTSIELADKLAESTGRKPVKNIQISISDVNFPIVGTPSPNKIHPNNIVDAQFSDYYQVAACWLYGSNQGWAIYDHIDDSKVHDICDKIHIESKKLQNPLETTMEVTLEDGTKQKLVVPAPQWEPDRPPSMESVERKFTSLCSRAIGEEKTQKIAEWVAISDSTAVGGLFSALV